MSDEVNLEVLAAAQQSYKAALEAGDEQTAQLILESIVKMELEKSGFGPVIQQEIV